MSLIIPANTLASGGFAVDNSCRFNRGSSDNLTRTPSSASNRRTWTWSGWVKRSGLGNIQTLFDGSDGGYPEIFYFDADDKFLYHNDIVGADYKLISSQVFRDVSAWYHIVVAKDTTQSTETNRLKIYVNGSQITMNESALGYPAQNFEGAININDLHIIGNWKGNSYYVDGYLCEVAFIDGTQNAVTDFGEFDEDSGIWKPIDVSGLTFGTNGFYLDFEDSSALGNDVSGNDNDFTVNNLTAIDQSTDTCTNNFATLNPLNGNNYAGLTFSEGNLKVTTTAGQYAPAQSTIGFNTGKWYAEFKATDVDNWTMVGIVGQNATATDQPVGYFSDGYGYIGGSSAGGSNSKINNNSASSYGATYTDGDIISVAVDCDNNYIYFGLNGTWLNSGDPESGASGTGSAFSISSTPASGFYYFASGNWSGSQTPDWEANFGSPPFTISSGNTDGNGYGNFEYAVPSGYLSLCTKNLSEVLG